MSDVGIANTWPVRFRADVQPPPPEAIERREMSLPGAVPQRWLEIAIGWPVVYEDVNGNGKLDLIGPDQVPVDKIVADGGDIYLFWQNATDDDWAFLSKGASPGFLFSRGVNVIRDVSAMRPLGPECIDHPCESPAGPFGRVALPKEDEIVMPVSTNPAQAGRYMCERFEGLDSSQGSSATPCPSPLPEQHGKICYAHDRSVYMAALIRGPLPLPLCKITGRVSYCGVHGGQASDWPCK